MRRLFLIAAFIAMAASACVGDEKIVMPTTLVWELGDETFVMRAMKCDKILHLKATGSNGTVFRFVRLPKENWKHIQMEEPLRLEYMCNMLQFFNSIITERYCRYNDGVIGFSPYPVNPHGRRIFASEEEYRYALSRGETRQDGCFGRRCPSAYVPPSGEVRCKDYDKLVRLLNLSAAKD
jgi:hypothetical protein